IAGSVFDHGLALNVPRWLGVYGAGFVAAVVAATGLAWRNRVGFSLRQRGLALAGAGVVAAMALVPPQIRTASAATSYQGGELRIAGTQLEFPAVPDVLAALDRLVAKHSGAELLVLSEYTFETPVPPSVKNWCRAHHRYLLAGAKQFAGSGKYYNIASVIGPDGLEVFQQAKSVPIQFFQDGIPAAHQSVWQSPWGTVGICVCYDLSYARVTDELIRQGARALIVPAMDVADWGEHQHELNRRVAFTRAAEYGVPIFRLASSGISQLVDHTGLELANAPFPGTEEMIHGTLDLETSNRPTLPWDRALASGCVAITASLVAFFLAVRARKRLSLLWSKSRSIATVPENS
ncbi:MAG TPA: carbon-nitrogen hydrolase family protein, partial [Verrucomicrobiae bacterium]|nr:carbon-nitrogen hydrolase family protein [Verrucomicrobiae bacterium]